jgi:hypothetical protein
MNELLRALAVFNKYLPNSATLADLLHGTATIRLLSGLFSPETKPSYAMALTAFNRPGYLREVLYTLANNAGLEKYTLHVGLEPANADVVKVCDGIQFMPTVIHRNPHSLGVAHNPYNTIKTIFDTTDVPGVLYLEDDVILSPDAVRLATWYLEHPERDKYLCLNLYNHDSKADADPGQIYPGTGFSALCLAVTRHNWKTHFEPNWYRDGAGWDHSVTGLIAEKKLQVLLPAISRSHHIGREGGTFYTTAYDHIYCNNPMCTQPAKEFRIEKLAPSPAA